MLTFLLLAGVPALFAWAVWGCYLYPKYFSPLRHLPAPKSGGFNLFRRGALEAVKDPLEALRKRLRETPNDGLIRLRDLFGIGTVWVVGPAALAEVLVHKCYDFEKSWGFIGETELIMGHGILLAEREEHKKQRKALSPAFSFRSIKNLNPLFWEKACAMVKHVLQNGHQSSPDENPNEMTVEIEELASRVTLDIMGMAGLDRELQSLSQLDSPLVQCYLEMFNRSVLETVLDISLLLLPGAIRKALPTRRNRLAHQAETLAKTYTEQLLDRRHQEGPESKGSHADLATVALESGMSPSLIVEQMRTFLVAGHDTTAAAFTWAIYLMCKHPETQFRLRDEITAAIGGLTTITDPESTSNAPDISTLPYLSAFTAEVLRLYPPVPVTSRIASVSTTICGHPIPKGTYIILCPWAINVLPSLWGPDAAEFKPERWLAARGTTRSSDVAVAVGPAPSSDAAERSNFSFLTFLHGPRSCIGERFAREEFKVLLAAWTCAFETRLRWPDRAVRVDTTGGGISAKPKGGLEVVVRPLVGEGERDL